MKFAPQNWNDILALFVLALIPALWVLQINLGGEVNGALIATWTLVIQYYFRKAPPGGAV